MASVSKAGGLSGVASDGATPYAAAKGRLLVLPRPKRAAGSASPPPAVVALAGKAVLAAAVLEIERPPSSVGVGVAARKAKAANSDYRVSGRLCALWGKVCRKAWWVRRGKGWGMGFVGS